MSNLLRYTPYAYFRAGQQSLAHDGDDLAYFLLDPADAAANAAASAASGAAAGGASGAASEAASGARSGPPIRE